MAQDAAVAALERWPAEGVPERPAAWLLTVARGRAIDRWRREANVQGKLVALKQTEPEEDDRLSLLFTCCHPALGRDAQVALTLAQRAALPPPRSPAPS